MASIPVNSSHREKLKSTCIEVQLNFHQGGSREVRFHFLKPFSGGHRPYPGDPQCGCMEKRTCGLHWFDLAVSRWGLDHPTGHDARVLKIQTLTRLLPRNVLAGYDAPQHVLQRAKAASAP